MEKRFQLPSEENFAEYAIKNPQDENSDATKRPWRRVEPQEEPFEGWPGNAKAEFNSAASHAVGPVASPEQIFKVHHDCISDEKQYQRALLKGKPEDHAIGKF